MVQHAEIFKYHRHVFQIVQVQDGILTALKMLTHHDFAALGKLILYVCLFVAICIEGRHSKEVIVSMVGLERIWIATFLKLLSCDLLVYCLLFLGLSVSCRRIFLLLRHNCVEIAFLGQARAIDNYASRFLNWSLDDLFAIDCASSCAHWEYLLLPKELSHLRCHLLGREAGFEYIELALLDDSL